MLAKTTFLTHLLAIEYAENNIDKPLSTFALFILPYKCYACQVFSALVVSLFLAHILWGCFNIEIPSEMEVALRFTLFICLYVNKIGRAGWSPLTRTASPEGSTKKTLPKAQRTRGLSSYHLISIKHQLQNLGQTSASRLNLKLKS